MLVGSSAGTLGRVVVRWKINLKCAGKLYIEGRSLTPLTLRGKKSLNSFCRNTGFRGKAKAASAQVHKHEYSMENV